MDSTTGSMRYTGLSGYYWSSAAYPGEVTAAYYLDFYTAYVYPSYHYNRYYGFSAS